MASSARVFARASSSFPVEVSVSRKARLFAANQKFGFSLIARS